MFYSGKRVNWFCNTSTRTSINVSLRKTQMVFAANLFVIFFSVHIVAVISYDTADRSEIGPSFLEREEIVETFPNISYQKCRRGCLGCHSMTYNFTPEQQCQRLRYLLGENLSSNRCKTDRLLEIDIILRAIDERPLTKKSLFANGAQVVRHVYGGIRVIAIEQTSLRIKAETVVKITQHTSEREESRLLEQFFIKLDLSLKDHVILLVCLKDCYENLAEPVTEIFRDVIGVNISRSEYCLNSHNCISRNNTFAAIGYYGCWNWPSWIRLISSGSVHDYPRSQQKTIMTYIPSVPSMAQLTGQLCTRENFHTMNGPANTCNISDSFTTNLPPVALMPGLEMHKTKDSLFQTTAFKNVSLLSVTQGHFKHVNRNSAISNYNVTMVLIVLFAVFLLGLGAVGIVCYCCKKKQINRTLIVPGAMDNEEAKPNDKEPVTLNKYSRSSCTCTFHGENGTYLLLKMDDSVTNGNKPTHSLLYVAETPHESR